MKKILNFKSTTSEKPNKIYWIFTVTIFLLLLPNFFYNDLIVTTRQSINLWHCIIDDSIFNFFAYNSNPDNLQTYSYIPIQGCAYSFVVYFVFALWNIPLFLLERVWNINIFAHPAIVFYSKLILVIFIFLSANILKKICLQLKMSESKASWAAYLFSTSALVFSCVIIIGQYDIFSIYFTLLGVYAYIKDDKLGFLGWFSVAFLFKFFSFLLFFPLLLLKQKKILRIFKYTIYTFIPYVFLKIVFLLGTTYTGKTDTGGMSSMFFSAWFNNADLHFGNINFSIFIFAITLICVYSYYLKPESDELTAQYTIYISALSYLSFFVFIPAYPYWYVLLAPFVVILLFLNHSNFKLNLLLESIGMGCLFFSQQISGAYWCFSYRLFKPTFWNAFFDVNSSKLSPKFTHEFVDYTGYLLGFENLSLLLTLFSGTLFVASMTAILVINHPKRLPENDEPFIMEKSVVAFRNTINIALAVLPIIVFLLNVTH